MTNRRRTGNQAPALGETLDSLSALAISRAHGCSVEMIEETRRMLVRYLEPYLD